MLETCHIVDKILCETDTDRLSRHNTLLLLPSVHRSFDNRLFWIDPNNGRVVCSSEVVEEQLAELGIPKDACLPASLLTPQRKEYLKRCINTYSEFALLKASKKKSSS